MKTAKHLMVVSSLLLAAGCANDKDPGPRYSEYPSSTYYGTAGSPTSPSSSTTSPRTTTSASESAIPSTTTSTSPIPATSSDSDRRLVSQVQQTLTQDTTLAAVYPRIQVSAQGGTVTLTGNVSTEQEKQKIEAAVKGASGVVAVNNQLQVSVSPTSDRPGQSGRLYQESTTQPSTPGATPGEQPSQTPSEPKTDTSSTSTSSTDATASTSSTTTTPTDTTTTAGLAGEKPGELSPTSQRPEASSRIYSSSQTGTDVLNMNIQGLTEADKTLGQKIMQELRTDTTLAPQLGQLQIKVDGGKLTLMGTVKSEEQKQVIESSVQRVTGVTSVENQLQVSATGATAPTTGTTTPASQP